MEIQEFQEMMKRLYFFRDKKRGLKETYEWLTDEVKELGEALQQEDLEVASKEFADVMAWLASLANLVGVNLEKASLSKYSNKCPKCQKSPCQCASS